MEYTHDGKLLKSWKLSCKDRNEDLTHEIFVRHSSYGGAIQMANELIKEYICEVNNLLGTIAFELDTQTMRVEEAELCLRCLAESKRSYHIPVTKDNDTGRFVHNYKTITNKFRSRSWLKFWEAHK